MLISKISIIIIIFFLIDLDEECKLVLMRVMKVSSTTIENSELEKTAPSSNATGDRSDNSISTTKTTQISLK